MWGTTKKHTGKCVNCGCTLELIDLNAQKGSKVLQCQGCGLLHYYRKEFFGGWKFIRATKATDRQEKK